MSFARTVTAPDGTLRRVERTSALLDATRDVPWTVTRAPASGWPVLWSVTWPATLPCCARTDVAAPQHKATTAVIATRVGRCVEPMVFPLSGTKRQRRNPRPGSRDGPAAGGRPLRHPCRWVARSHAQRREGELRL